MYGAAQAVFSALCEGDSPGVFSLDRKRGRESVLGLWILFPGTATGTYGPLKAEPLNGLLAPCLRPILDKDARCPKYGNGHASAVCA